MSHATETKGRPQTRLLVGAIAALTLGSLVVAGCVTGAPAALDSAPAPSAGTSAGTSTLPIVNTLPNPPAFPDETPTSPGAGNGLGTVPSPSMAAESSASGSAASRSASVSTPAAPLAGSSPVIVTGSDGGKTVRLLVGQTFALELGSTVSWTVSIGDDRIVVRAADASVPAGAQGVYEAIAPGITTLTAAELRQCATGRCPLFQVAFVVTIVVS